MAGLAFKNITGNVLSPRIQKVSLSNSNKEIQLEVVKYTLASEGIRLSIENGSRDEIYSYLNDNNVFFKILTKGIHNTIILVTEFDYIEYI